MTEVIKQALSPLYTLLITMALIIWTSIVTAIITLFVIRRRKRRNTKRETPNTRLNTETEKYNCQETTDNRKEKHEQNAINRQTEKVRNQRYFTESETEENRPQITNWRTDKTKGQSIYISKEERVEPTSHYTHEEKEKHNKKIKEIGEVGERTSNFKTLPIIVYGKQLRNLYIPTQYGETTEIDTVLVSVSGIYVIETKNYNAKIYGQEEQKNWIAWYSEDKKFPFYNPIKQNEAHLKALKFNLHEVSENCFFSIIVFSDKCNIQKIEYNRTKNLITKQNSLSEEFKELLKTNEGKLSRQEVNNIFAQLKEFANVSEEVKQKHVENVKRKRTNLYYYES